MTKVVNKVFLMSDYDKEEQWLNEMADKGFVLTKVIYTKYYFEETKRRYKVRLSYMPKKYKEFISFLEESGAHYIGRTNNWGYFSKEITQENPTFEIYSDNQSKLNQINRVLKVMGGFTVACSLFIIAVTLYFLITYHSLEGKWGLSLIPLAIVWILYSIITVILINKRQHLIKEREIFE